MTIKKPIVAGAYYVDRDGVVLRFGKVLHEEHAKYAGFTRVHLVPTDPAEVVAELRGLQLSAHRDSHSEFGGRTDEAREEAFCEAADLVAQKLGVGS